MRPSLRFHPGLFLLALCVWGCSRDEQFDRVIVSGQVNFQGSPVPFGTIWFEAEESTGAIAPTGFALIRNGTFKTEQKDSPIPGKYRLRIMGYPQERKPNANIDDESPGIMPLFPEFIHNYDVEINAKPIVIDVPR